MICTNSTSNDNSCKSQATINEYFISKKIAFMISDNSFLANNYKNPVVPKITTQFFNLDYQISKKQRINIQKVSFSSEDGYVTSAATVIDTWKVGEITNDFDLNSQVNLFDITIYSTTTETQIIRSYMTIQDALSGLGGIVNVLILA